MRILFTGASSFTGCWFVRELVAAGHHVTATFRQGEGSYSGLKAARMADLPQSCGRAYSCPFGSSSFMRLIEHEDDWDLLCHHAAETRDYKRAYFDVLAAVASNTNNLDAVLSGLSMRGCRAVLLSGTYFEANEGGRRTEAASPYGLSKTLTSHCFAYYASARRMRMGRFIIPNPFGPMEELRFTSYLVGCWMRGETAIVNAPDALRDNIHVSLLAKCYADFAAAMPWKTGKTVLRPSGYVETQGAFAQRFAAHMRKRLPYPCKLSCAQQADPQMLKARFNAHQPDAQALGWSEEEAWDSLARYYRSQAK